MVFMICFFRNIWKSDGAFFVKSRSHLLLLILFLLPMEGKMFGLFVYKLLNLYSSNSAISSCKDIEAQAILLSAAP